MPITVSKPQAPIGSITEPLLCDGKPLTFCVGGDDRSLRWSPLKEAQFSAFELVRVDRTVVHENSGQQLRQEVGPWARIWEAIKSWI